MNDSCLTPSMIGREAVRLVSHITNHRYENSITNTPGQIKCAGINLSIRSYKNDANFYFDIWCGADVFFTISFPMFDDIWKLSLDDFAEYKLIQELYKKLEAFGYATWD